MASQLTLIGYEFLPSKYSPGLGYSGLNVVISGQPTQRFFDIKLLSLPTFDGRFFHQSQVTRHELEPTETFQVCLGEMRMETFRREALLAFSFGGNLKASIEKGDLYCEFTSNAPIFKLDDDPVSMGGVFADEIMDLVAEIETNLGGHEDEFYAKLVHFNPYQIFLACLVSLEQRVASLPTNLRRERLQALTSSLTRATHILRDADNWDGTSLSLENLLSSGGA
jgi:hypothetical protein